MNNYQDCCIRCGGHLYRTKRELNGVTIMGGKCPICKRENVGIVPARDWAWACGDLEKRT